MTKTKVNIVDPETGKNRVGVHDDKTHIIKTSDRRELKPKNTKVNQVFTK